MKLTKWNSFDRNLFGAPSVDIINRLFDDVLQSPFGLRPGPCRSIQSLDNLSFNNVAQHPVRKKQYDDGKIRVEFDVPGLNKKDLQLSYKDDVLLVTSKSKEETEQSISTRSFNYKIFVPDLDVATIEASCEKGVLVVNACTNIARTNKHTIEIK